MYYCTSNIIQEVSYSLLTMKRCSEFSFTMRAPNVRHRHFKNRFTTIWGGGKPPPDTPP